MRCHDTELSSPLAASLQGTAVAEISLTRADRFAAISFAKPALPAFDLPVARAAPDRACLRRPVSMVVSLLLTWFRSLPLTIPEKPTKLSFDLCYVMGFDLNQVLRTRGVSS